MPQPLRASNPTLDFGRDICHDLQSLPTAYKYVSEERLSKSKLTLACVHLFASPADGGQSLFQPLSTEEVDVQVIKSGLFRECFPRESKGLGCLGCFIPAMFRTFELEHILAGRTAKRDWDEIEPAPEGLIDKDWEEDNLEMQDDIFGEMMCGIRAGVFFSYKAKDDTMAHVQTWLASGTPLSHEKISRAELATIVMMTIVKLSREEFKHHRICPVLFSSCANNQLRVIVGYLDGNTRTVHIHKSPVWDFGNQLDFEETKQVENPCSVLGWHLSKPCGSTM